MHSYIYELSSDPVLEEDRYSNEDLPSGFCGSIADGTYDVAGEERELAIESLTLSLGTGCTFENDCLKVFGIVKQLRFTDHFIEFQRATNLLSTIPYEVFSGQRRSYVFSRAWTSLKEFFEDKYGIYIYWKDQDELMTLDAWLREADLPKAFYVGGVIDYHW